MRPRRGLMVRDAQERAPHHEGQERSLLRRRCEACQRPSIPTFYRGSIGLLRCARNDGAFFYRRHTNRKIVLADGGDASLRSSHLLPIAIITERAPWHNGSSSSAHSCARSPSTPARGAIRAPGPTPISTFHI